MKANVWVTKRKTKRGYSYAIQWEDPRTGRRRTESCGTDKAFARQRAAEQRMMLMEGRQTGIRYISYDNFVSEHLEQVSSGSYSLHEFILRKFKEICHPKDLKVIDFQMVERFRKVRLDGGIKPATVNKNMRTLQGILQKAVRRGYLRENLFRSNRRDLMMKESEPVFHIVEAKDFQQLLDTCLSAKWWAICLLAYYAGLRRGEIVALERSDIDFANSEIHVNSKTDHATKSRKHRTVCMTTQVRGAMEALAPDMLKRPYIFADKPDDAALNSLTKGFIRLVKRAGFVDKTDKPLFTLHDLRRSCATNLSRAGVDPKTIQDILGHSSFITTMKYYVGAQNNKDAMKKLESYIA